MHTGQTIVVVKGSGNKKYLTERETNFSSYFLCFSIKGFSVDPVLLCLETATIGMASAVVPGSCSLLKQRHSREVFGSRRCVAYRAGQQPRDSGRLVIRCSGADADNRKTSFKQNVLRSVCAMFASAALVRPFTARIDLGIGNDLRYAAYCACTSCQRRYGYRLR